MNEVQSYEYVVLPYVRVRDALMADASAFLSRTLHATVGPLSVGVDVNVSVVSVKESRTAIGDPHTTVELSWRAASHAALFPVMEATLSVYPLSGNETQLDLHGRYQPPGSVAGTAVDAAVGSRVAESVVSRFLKEVRDRLLGTAETSPTAA